MAGTYGTMTTSKCTLTATAVLNICNVYQSQVYFVNRKQYKKDTLHLVIIYH